MMPGQKTRHRKEIMAVCDMTLKIGPVRPPEQTHLSDLPCGHPRGMEIPAGAVIGRPCRRGERNVVFLRGVVDRHAEEQMQLLGDGVALYGHPVVADVVKG